MTAFSTIEDLRGYCFRQLGSPVINIEVDHTQAYDRIEDAINYFTERHYDGVEHIYYHKTIKYADEVNGYFSVPPEYSAMIEVMNLSNQSTSIDNLDNFQFNMRMNLNEEMMRGSTSNISEYFMSMSHLNLINDILSNDKNFDYNSTTNILRPRWKLSSVGSSNLLKSPTNFATQDWTLVNCSSESSVADSIGGSSAVRITTNAAGSFSVSQTIPSKRYLLGDYSARLTLMSETFAGNVTVTLSDGSGSIFGTLTIPNQQKWNESVLEAKFDATATNDLVLTISGTATVAGESLVLFSPYVYMNNIIVLNGYRELMETDVSLLNNRWLREYATAMIKLQWGNNLKKMSGVQMVGGIELNGQQIYDEAKEEIQTLREEFTMNYQEPAIGGWF